MSHGEEPDPRLGTEPRLSFSPRGRAASGPGVKVGRTRLRPTAREPSRACFRGAHPSAEGRTRSAPCGASLRARSETA